MRKTLSLLLAIIMVFSLLPLTAFAAGDARIYFDTTFEDGMEAGDTFTVTGYLENNPGIYSMCLTLKWNDKVVKFNGFETEYDEDAEEDVLKSDVFAALSIAVNHKLGIVTGYRTQTTNTKKNGTLFVANFEIISGGDMGLGLKTDDATEYEIKNIVGDDINPILDYSAISGLKAAGEGAGPDMPEDAPFTAITTDAGPIVAIEEADWVNGAPYYIVTIPADATTAYVTAPDQVVMEDWTTGEIMATAYAASLEDMSTLEYVSYYYEETDDGPKVEIPMEMTTSDWSGNEVNLCFFSNDEYNPATHAFGIEDASYACLGLISFVYEGGAEEYSISIDENMVGGTIIASDEDGNEISKAKAGETVFVEVEADEGYTTNGAYYVNGQIANDFMFVMPEEDVVLSATFTATHTCEFKEVVADEYLKEAATCQHAAEYFKSCECGATSEETFFDGETVGCVYENGTCKWCGAAEPVVAPGYRFATSADVSAENGDTAVVHVKITGHSDPNVTSYNAYDLTLTFDSEKLEYVGFDGAVKSDNGRVEVDAENGTIRIVGCGTGKPFGTEIAALTFMTKAEGQANVTIDKVLVADSEDAVKDAPVAVPQHKADDTTADETPDESVIVVPYSVTKPDFISGNNKVLHGETYTFSYADTTNYTYADLTVTVGGAPVTPTEENGTYTIAGVTGAIKITATQTPNSYDVNKPKNVTGPDKATYSTPYIFTVTPSADDLAIDTVKVTLADGSEVPYTVNDNGEYVIAGTNITGAFTITVTEKEKMTTVTFSGIEATEIEGGLIQTAVIGNDFTFQLKKEEGYDYTVKVGETVLTEVTETPGVYIIPAELVVKGGVQVDITKEDNTKPVVDVVEYINLDGKTMFLVTAKWRDKVLAYGEEGTMFWSDKYTVTGEAEAGAYCWLVVSTTEMNTIDKVKAAAEDAIVEAAEGATATAVKYKYDVNGTTKVDVNDAQLAYDMYNAAYMEFTDTLPMWKFLEADMETDAKLDTQDVAAIISYIVSGANA